MKIRVTREVRWSYEVDSADYFGDDDKEMTFEEIEEVEQNMSFGDYADTLDNPVWFQSSCAVSKEQ